MKFKIDAQDSEGKTIKTALYGWAYVVRCSTAADPDYSILTLQLPGTYDPEDTYKIQVKNDHVYKATDEKYA